MKQKNYQKHVKKKYKKLYFEHENLRKIYDILATQYNRTRKTKLIQAKKRKIAIPQDFEQSESEKSEEENEDEEQTEEESEVDKVISRKQKNKKTKKHQ